MNRLSSAVSRNSGRSVGEASTARITTAVSDKIDRTVSGGRAWVAAAWDCLRPRRGSASRHSAEKRNVTASTVNRCTNPNSFVAGCPSTYTAIV